MDSIGFIYILSHPDRSWGYLKYNSNGQFLLSTRYDPDTSSNTGGYGQFFDVAPNGEVAITGELNLNFQSKIFTAKYNAQGVFQWGRFYNPLSDYPMDVKIDRSGNVIIAGAIEVGGGDAYALIIKYNSNGDTVWTRQYTQFYGINRHIAIDDTNNIYFTGNVRYPPRCSVMKYNSQGDLKWVTQFTYDTVYQQNYGSAGDGIKLDRFGNVYILGAQATPPYGNSQNYILKLNNAGVIQWSHLSGAIVNGGYNGGLVIPEDGSAVYYATTATNGMGAGGYDIATLKYTAAGDSEWVRRFNGGTYNGYNQAAAIKTDKYGNVYILGLGNFAITGDDFVTIKYSPNGVQQWIATYNGIVTNSADHPTGLCIDTSLNIYVCGISEPNQSGGADAVIIKYNQPLGIAGNQTEIPKEYKLLQNYPNPFNPSTNIKFTVSKKSFVQLRVYDLLGRIIETPVDKQMNPSEYELTVNASNYTSGVYFYQMVADGNIIDTKKFILLK